MVSCEIIIDVSKLKAFPEVVKNAIKTGLLKGAFEVERQAKIYSPRDTGTMERSIGVDRITEQGDEMSITVSPKVDYADLMEMPGGLGPRSRAKGARRPFMQPALLSSVNQIKLHIFNELNKVSK